MNNREIAAVLFNISELLKRDHANGYRVRAYRRAARNLLRARHSVAERAQAGQPLDLPDLGPSLTAKISALATTGRLSFYEELCAAQPPVQHALLLLPGFGPKLAERVERDLNAHSPEDVLRAAATGRLRKVWGIGPRRAARIVQSLRQGEQFYQQRLV